MRIFPQPSTTDSEPVSLDQLKAQTRLGPEADNDLLARLLRASREEVETLTGTLIMRRAVTFTDIAWPSAGRFCTGEIELGVRPVFAVTAITYTASDGVVTTLAPAAYIVRERFGTTRIRVASGASWPSLGSDPQITIAATVGYAAKPTGSNPVVGVPEMLLDAILVGAQGRYDGSDYRAAVDALIAPFRAVSV